MKAGQYITYQTNWNIVHYNIPFILWLIQSGENLAVNFYFLLLPFPLILETLIGWHFKSAPLLATHQYQVFPISDSIPLKKKKDTDFIRNFCCHKKSLLDYHQSPPLHPQLQHFWCSVHLRKLFPNYQNSFLPSARSGGVSEFMEVPFFLLLFHGPT